MAASSHGALAVTPKPASNTPCPHTPLPNAWCSACPPRKSTTPVSTIR